MFALLGSGRLARHFSFYLSSLGLKPLQWSRNNDPLFNTLPSLESEERLRRTIESASHILLAVSDSAVMPLADYVAHLSGGSPTKVLVHFSGALTTDSAAGAHPLMTFGEQLEPLEWYRAIPFAIDEGRKFHDLLPGLPNAHYSIRMEQRPLYHALCSLAGNSTFMLWQKIGDHFERLGLPRALLRPFLHQVVANSSQSGEKNFTGPVARGDWQIVREHLASLEGQPELQGAYRNYLSLAKTCGFEPPEGLL